MPSIHFLCRDRLHVHRVKGTQEYESGNWAVDGADVRRLIGGMLYLHQTKSKRSYFGGRILSARPVDTDHAQATRYVFRFAPLQEARDVAWRGADHSMAWTSGVLEE